jgi:hypothetical protein
VLDWGAAAAAVVPPALAAIGASLPLERLGPVGGLAAARALYRHRGSLLLSGLAPLALLAARRPRSPATRAAALGIGVIALVEVGRRALRALAERPRRLREVAAAEADRFLSPDAPVLGLEANGEARAYPLGLALGPRLVHDVLGGVPVVPTYGPRAGAAIAFRDEAPGGPLRLEAIGSWHDDLVFFESRTEGLVRQLEARIGAGPFAGAPIETLPLALVRWEAWRTLFPETSVLAEEGGGPGARRLAAMPRAARGGEPLALGIAARGWSKAYARAALAARPVVEDAVHGLPIVVLYDAGRDLARAFERRLDGRLLAFARAAGERAVARADGSLVDVGGRFFEGPLAGRRLAPIALQVDRVLLSAWTAVRPETEVVPA